MFFISDIICHLTLILVFEYCACILRPICLPNIKNVTTKILCLYFVVFYILSFSSLDLTDYVINKKHEPAVYDLHGVSVSNYSANNYLLKVNNRNTRKRFKIYSKLTIKTPERSFEHISHLLLVFLSYFEQVNVSKLLLYNCL